MTEIIGPPTSRSQSQLSQLVERLNRNCHCISVDATALERALLEELDDDSLVAALRTSHPHLFAPSPVFVNGDDVRSMSRIVEAVHQVAEAPAYRSAVLGRAPAIAGADAGAHGVFYGFDFHLSDQGPKLIEINTNAGSALLNLYLARAQRACCAEVASFTTGRLGLDHFEDELIEMFERELALTLPMQALKSVAIVDQAPREQFLYPEMLLFERLFRRRGIEARIAGPDQLELDAGRLRLGGREVDLVYNRLTDFYFDQPEHAVLRQAYEQRRAAVTPHPHGYALFADKRNLCLLSRPERLSELGVDESTITTLAEGIPTTFEVSGVEEQELWSRRKSLFFKPMTGYGSRGAYAGARMTRKVFRSIVESGGYVAQEAVPPSQRFLIVDGQEQPLKVDVRAFVYDGAVQLLSARLYRGQTTNLRTAGGGLATVFVAPPSPS